MRKLITVKKRHIRAGGSLCGDSCAIALAINEAKVIPEAAWVGDRSLFIENGNKRIASLPRSAQRFIQRFDTCKSKCKPFRFFLDVEAQP